MLTRSGHFSCENLTGQVQTLVGITCAAIFDGLQVAAALITVVAAALATKYARDAVLQGKEAAREAERERLARRLSTIASVVAELAITGEPGHGGALQVRLRALLVGTEGPREFPLTFELADLPQERVASVNAHLLAQRALEELREVAEKRHRIVRLQSAVAARDVIAPGSDDDAR